MKKVNLLWFFVITAAIIASEIAIGPADFFVAGFSSEYPIYDFNKGYVSTYAPEGYFVEQIFVPDGQRCVGAELYFTHDSSDVAGTVLIEVEDDKGQTITSQRFGFHEIFYDRWSPIQFGTELKGNTKYTLRVTVSKAEKMPYLLIIPQGMGANENTNDINYNGQITEGELWITYAYSNSIFSWSEKVLILIALLLVEMGAFSLLVMSPERKKKINAFCFSGILVIVMSWSFSFNTFTKSNSTFNGFQADSEQLVTSSIVAELNNVKTQYPLGYFQSVSGQVNSPSDPWKSSSIFLSNAEYSCGYHTVLPQIIIDYNQYTIDTFIPGRTLLFNDGTKAKISTVVIEGTNLIVGYESEKILNTSNQGSLALIRVLDEEGNMFQRGNVIVYPSQFGLQGKIFRILSRYLPIELIVEAFHLVCCIALSLVLVFISALLEKKYGAVMSICFYSTNLLSPWIINFARNLYWVEFTWFIPMLVGLCCSMHFESRKVRTASYGAAFLSVLIKCLCGYEYISSILVGMMLFIFPDLVKYSVNKERKKALLLLKTMIILGVVAVAGFVVAIILHANIRGSGDILSGIKMIWEGDVLRRTAGGRLIDYPEVYWDSLKASVYDVVRMYVHFPTEIITGINGTLFPFILIAPVLVLFFDWIKKERVNAELLSMYIVALIGAISWIVLAKAHSYIHGHMNYVVWYMGFVQVAFYIIIDGIKCLFTLKSQDNNTLK